MNLQEYIITNWATLSKSNFNDDEVVIFKCDEDYDGGWGHHTYAGWGVDQHGNTVYCYSSGCSCNGSAYVESIKDVKVLIADKDISEVESADINFESLVVNFYDY